METNGDVSETEDETAEAPEGQLQRSVAATKQLIATLSEEARVSAMAGTVGEIYEEHCGTVNAAVQRYLHSLESNALLHAYATTIMLRHEFDLASGTFQWNPAGFYSKLERLHIRMIDYEQEKAELVTEGRIEDEARIVQNILKEMESKPMGEAAKVLERHVLPILCCDPITNILEGHLRELSIINTAAAKFNILSSNSGTEREFAAAAENIISNGKEEDRNQEMKLDTFSDRIIGVKDSTSLKERKSLRYLEMEQYQLTKRQLTEACDERKKQMVADEVSYLLDEMLSRIKGFVNRQSGQLQTLMDMPEDKLKDVFVNKWYEWLSELKKSCNPMTQEVISVEGIERDAFDVLCERFPDNLIQLLMRTTVSGRQLRQFSIEEFKANRSHYTMRRGRTTTQNPSELPTSEIDALAHQLITEAKRFLDLHLRQPQEYKKSDIHTALTKLQWRPNDKFQVTSMFELDLAMAFSGYAIRQLYDQHNRFLKANDPVLILEDQLNHYFIVFKTILKEKDAQSTILALMKSIDTELIIRLRDTHWKQLFSKSSINNVLATLAREDNFGKYEEYLRSPQVVIDRYLRALVCSMVRVNVGDAEAGGAVEAVVARLRAEVVGCEARCPFCLEPCMYWDGGHEVAASPRRDWRPTRHATDPDHAHKPIGCLGYRDPRTGALSTATCGERVTRLPALTFANADTSMREVRYADFDTIYPDWEITDNQDTDSGEGSYWKWFMCHYNEDLAKLYASKPANIPEAWKSLTRDGEIRKLLHK